MTRGAPLLCMLSLAALVVAASVCVADVPASRAPVVRFHAMVDPSPIHPGEVAEAKISAVIVPGFHIYSVQTTPGAGPIPTTVRLTGPNITPAPFILEDALVVKFDAGFQKNVAYHESSAIFTVPFRVGMESAHGKASIPIAISVHYQACNAIYCMPPADATLAVALPVVPGPVRDSFRNEPTPRSTMLVSPFPAPKHPPATSRTGLLAFIAAAFAAGLLALITPCVFPLIPVTFGFFTKQLGASGGKLVALAATYALGIVISFTALGLIVAATVGENGPNRIAANPWFNILFGLLFIVFGFAFFETFTPRLPGFLQRFTRPAQTGSRYVTVLLMGLAFVFAAFTCTAPFVATVLSLAVSAAHSGGWVRPVLGMVFFSLALALPFFLLSLFPSLLAKLPRSGSWLSVTKAVIGFIELAFAVLYFSKADLVWQAEVLTRPVIFGLWAVIAVCGALYLFGALKLSRYQEAPERITAGRAVGAVLFSALACYCFYAQSGRPINAALGAFLPPPGYGEVGRASDDRVQWLSDYDLARKESTATGKPLFIDFTGYTCTNCRWMELNIFPKAAVESQLAQFVTVRLYTDGGVDGPKNQALQSSLTGEVAQPLYAVLAPDGRKVTQSVGLDANPAHFAAFLAGGFAAAIAPLASVSPVDSGGVPASGTLALAPADAKAWVAYDSSALQSARTAHRPMIVDFSADWCVPCHAIERTVFSDPAVMALTPRFDTYKANLTDYYGAASTKLEDQFGIEALPTIVFIDADGNEAPDTRVTGIIKPADFAARMRTTLAIPTPRLSARPSLNPES